MSPVLETSLDDSGFLLELRLNRPKANIIDAEMIDALGEALTEYRDDPSLKAVLLSAQGPNFSFGASVEEHLPEKCAEMLWKIHRLVLKMVEFPLPILVAVQGQCLGGGLEVAASGSFIFATPDAQFGQPEIKLGIFAPAASCLFPEKISRSDAEDLLFSGRSVSGREAATMGLVFRLTEDPRAKALEYFEEHLAPRSATALRFAVAAARHGLARRVRERIGAIEALYLDDLMKTHDAVEGLEAFIEKRPAIWTNG